MQKAAAKSAPMSAPTPAHAWQPYTSPFNTGAATPAGVSRHSHHDVDGRTLRLHSGGRGSSLLGAQSHLSSLSTPLQEPSEMRNGSSQAPPPSSQAPPPSGSWMIADGGPSTLHSRPSRLCSDTAEPITDTGAISIPLRDPPPPNSGARVRMEFMHYQLDTLAGREVLRTLVLERGHANRMQGGVVLTRCVLL